MNNVEFSEYYQAKVEKSKTWFLVSVLRSFENLAFDRTLNKQETLFEFFVPKETEVYFLKIMKYFEQKGIISNLEKLPNRFL